jgi:unsaturated chondroitin disaccharide hydrolase
MIEEPNFQDLQAKLRNAFNFAQKQVLHLTTMYPDFFPMYTKAGKWRHEGESWTNWCEGFLGGMMWIFYKRTREDQWSQRAEHYSRLIEERQHDRTVHDLGFLFWSTWKRWYDLTGDEALNQAVINAGKTMGLRFKEKGQYMRSFVAEDSLFIDIMMNVGIVFYAAQQSGDADLLRKAHQHCGTTRRYLVRGDGSTAHEGIFDLESGEFLRQSTHQGWRGDSAWARGQCWAFYGFSTAYRLTGERRYLSTARMCADFYVDHTSFEAAAPFGPGVPPNDWDDPAYSIEGSAPPESSAAAIAASGLLDLSQTVQDPVYARRYRQAALIILDTLTGTEYLADQTPGWEGILKRGCYHLIKGLGVDESVMWGDYFFVEALDKALDLKE